MNERHAVALLAGLGVLASCRDLYAACVGRPADASGYAGYKYAPAEVKSYATAQVRVHYATTGAHAVDPASTRPDSVPNTVALAADLGEEALTKYAEMGFKKVPSDVGCPSNGGDDKVDIYLVQFAGADGSTAAECNGGACSSFVLVESTFATKGYATAEEGFKTVVTHELFHAVQNAYRDKRDAFWSEGTAQWAMKKLHPELQDFERQLPAFFVDTSRSLDQPPSGPTAGFLYGSAVFPLFLTLKIDDNIIREVLEIEATGKDSLPAIAEAVEKRGTSFADLYPLFGAWNAGTGRVSSTGGYPDAAKYPGIKLGKLEDGVAGITSGVSYFAFKGTLAAKQDVVLETDPSRNAGVAVPVEGGTLKLERAAKLPATIDAGEWIVVVAGTTTKKTDARFAIRFQEPGTAVVPTADAGASSSSSSSGGGDDGCNAAPANHSSSPSGFVIVGAALMLGLALRSKKRA